MARELYRVYVDETGDRGWGGRASPIFVVSAVIVRDQDVPVIRGALDQINADLNQPAGTVLHWSQNVKGHSKRRHVSRILADLPMLCTSVVVVKTPLMGSGTQLSDAASMYNYCVRRLLERISWCVDELGGEAIVTFAHVHKFPYDRLHAYIELLQSQATQIRWNAFRRVGKRSGFRIDQPRRVRPLQVADLVAGCIGSALRADRFGAFEDSYLFELVPRIYIRGGGRVESYGLNIVGPRDCMATYPWWDAFRRRCAEGPGRQ